MHYNWSHIIDHIRQRSGLTIPDPTIAPVSGGCINSCFLLGKGAHTLFVKINRRTRLDMFEAEAAGLRSMAQADAIRVPRVVCTGVVDEHAFFAMQAIEMGPPKADSYRNFGRQLATMHHYQQAQYGFATDNTIGSTTQINRYSDDWFSFWRAQRLGYQIDLAQHNNAPARLIDDGLRLNELFPALFDTPPTPSCLHGDLWQGNWGFDSEGRAVIFDPAHYFGDRETDIAMTTLFGRAHGDFYAAYQEAFPLDPGYSVRETFYNIYHILNHYNLFGGSYAQQAHTMIQNVLSELS